MKIILILISLLLTICCNGQNFNGRNFISIKDMPKEYMPHHYNISPLSVNGKILQYLESFNGNPFDRKEKTLYYNKDTESNNEW